MRDVWVENEWRDLCDRLLRAARHCARPNCETEAEQFAKQEPPQRYLQLLGRIREASRLALSWQEQQHRSSKPDINDAKTKACEDSFAASDPPAWSTATV